MKKPGSGFVSVSGPGQGWVRQSFEDSPSRAAASLMGRAGAANQAAPTAPGQLTSHYAPNASVRLNATAPLAGESYLGFGAQPESDDIVFFNLSPKGDLVEAATNLFTGLRWLDSASDRIAVAPIPETGLGEAINDRLRRAAAER